MTIPKKEFIKFSTFMNFNFTDSTNKELLKNKMFTVEDIYKNPDKLTDKVKKEVNNIFKQYGNETI